MAAAAEAGLKAEAGKLGAALRQTLAARLATDTLAVGQATFGLEIADGQVRGRLMVIETRRGPRRWRHASGPHRVQARFAVAAGAEGAGFGRDSAKRPLPPVIVSYRAPLAALKAREQQIDTTAVEQELSARKIEQDLEELERLRKLNEADPLHKAPVPATPARVRPRGRERPPSPPFGHEVKPGAPG